VSQLDLRPDIVPAPAGQDEVPGQQPEGWESAPADQGRREQAPEPSLFEEAPPTVDWTMVRLLATEPRPAGFGEVLVTDAWSPPAPRETSAREEPGQRIAARPYLHETRPGEPQISPDAAPRTGEDAPPPSSDRQKAWETRQELRELGLVRERPLVSYDARFESYWRQVSDAMRSAPEAMVDPYTQLAAEFADADLSDLSEHKMARREYGRQAESLLELARAYWAIGRHKSAGSALEAAAGADPLDPAIWYNLGVVRLLSRAGKAAREALERCTDQAPGDFRGELALAVACYQMRDYAAAEEHFRRLAGPSGLRATARSMLACSMRMQGNWDEARVELGFLKQASPGDRRAGLAWRAMSQQCLDCVERGEQKLAGALRRRRQGGQMWRAVAASVAGGIWVVYGMAQDLFKREAQWAVVPLFGLALLIARSLKRISGRELPDEFGNAEQGLVCWQSTAWMRPRRSEFG
jgi:tetratricopeptide (TPR) repeat protein